MKRVLLLLFALLFASLSILPVMATTGDTPINQNAGYSADRVETKDLTNVPDIKTLTRDNYKESGNEFKITDPEGLKHLSVLTNSLKEGESVKGGEKFEGKTVYLAANIDMKDITDFVPIGSGSSLNSYGSATPKFCWCGTFDGQGYTISNLKVEGNNLEPIKTDDGSITDIVCVGMFGFVERNAVIKNLRLDETCSFTYSGSSTRAQTAAVVAYGCSHGKANAGPDELNKNTPLTYIIDNVYTAATVSGGTGHTGAILGASGAATGNRYRIQNCTNAGTVTGGETAGGMIGTVLGRCAVLINCLNSGSVTAKRAGGMIAEIDSSGAKSHMNNCSNTGTITGIDVAGGIIGALLQNNTYINACSNSGQVIATGANGKIGGIYATVSSSGNPELVKDCVDYADIQSGDIGERDDGIDNLAEIPANVTVGYDPARIVAKDLTNVTPISEFLDVAESGCAEFKISTPDELAHFSELVNTYAMAFTEMTVYLAADIDMSGVTDFKPIGYPGDNADDSQYNNDRRSFRGTFDGQGHVIDNLVIHHSHNAPEGSKTVFTALFGKVHNGTIKNLVLGSGCQFIYDGTSVLSSTAAVVAYAHQASDTGVTVDNVMSAATVKGGTRTAGIVAFASGKNVTTEGKFTATNCTNIGTVEGKKIVGGIVGYVFTRVSEIRDCRNTGTLTVTGTAAGDGIGAGGILGYAQIGEVTMLVEECINNGAVKAPGAAGGIVAILDTANVMLQNCINYGNAEATAQNAAYPAGAIYGYTSLFVFESLEKLSDKSGENDPTLATVPTITPNFPTDNGGNDSNSGNDGNGSNGSNGGNGENADDGNTDNGGGTTDAPTTSAPDSNETASAENVTDAPAATEKSGCASVLTGGLTLSAVMCIGAAGAALAGKKKR